MTKQQLIELIDRYWDIAHKEGVDGRDHDTPEGYASETRQKIIEGIDSLVDRTNWHSVYYHRLELKLINAPLPLLATQLSEIEERLNES
jgi:hypothetical protein